MSDALNIANSGPVCLSPASSSASDSDAFNTADARIHFGPLRSPEQKFGPIIARRSTLHPGIWDSPLRRSPRLSTPQPRSPSPEPMLQHLQGSDPVMNQVQEHTETIDVPPGTPDIERALRDEPPSALAIKISRAHDNPSPPPSTPTTTALIGIASPSPRLPFRTVHAAQLVLRDANQSESSTPPTSSNASPGLSTGFRSLPPTTPGASGSTSHADLISFDSFSTPAPVFRTISPQASTSKLPLLGDKPSADDLSSQSPSLFHPQNLGNARGALPQVIPVVAIEFSGAEDRKGKGKATAEAFQESIEEQSVIESLLLPEAERPYRVPSRSPLPNNPDVAGVTQEPVRTSVRRSTRPRRSGASYKSATTSEDYEMLDGTRNSRSGLTSDETDQSRSNQEGRDEDGGTTDENKAERTARSNQMNSAPKSVFHRELGSLSPTSTNLLSSLVASPSRQPLPFSLAVPESATTNTVPGNLLRRPFPIFSHQSLPQTPQRSTSPIRFASPSRSAVQKSTNTRLQPVGLDDPNRTPARRIPIAEAVAQGHVSPSKGSRLLATRGRAGIEASQTPILTIPPSDSPARRVEKSEAATPAVHKKWQGIGFRSPSRGTSKERSGSVEPPLSGPSGSKTRERGGSQSTKEFTSMLRPTASGSSTSRTAQLPFPIITSQRVLPASIAEETKPEIDVSMASPAKPDQAVFSSPFKSRLKQTTSRIPRTAKPYARPAPKPSDKGKSSITTLRRVNPTTKMSQSVVVVHRTVTADAGIGSSPDDVKSKEPGTLAGKDFVTTSTLERKRVVPERASPFKSRPVVVLRQVPRAGGSTTSTARVAALPSVTITKKPLDQIRRVVDKHPDTQPGSQMQPSQLAQQDSGIELSDVPGVDSDDKETSVPEADKISSPPSSQDVAAPQPDIPSDGVRRTTRVRKAVNPTAFADAFGSSDGRSLPPRRNANARTTERPDQTFMGMSATALKALTTSNTVKNQRYLAAKLETEVIRKEGARPESPVVKIRTIVQRQQDEKGKQRKERAARRARRSEDGTEDQSEMDVRSDVDSDSESDSDDQNSSPTPKRHKRGPGDEDDYQTPVRKLKRLKLNESDEDDLREDERRVKWDRGLFTTIYLDEVKLGTRRPPKENIASKGCLAPTAKAVPLDNLGNLPHADAPLMELIEESVVVKKFVYDNDVEPVQEVVVKNTRLRSKKGRS